MAFRNIRLGFLNAYREAGIANVTSEQTQDALYPIDNIMDDSASRTFRTNVSLGTHRIIVDRGLGWAALRGIDRIYIPAGHNLTGNLEVKDDSAIDFVTTPATLLTATAVSTTVGEAFQDEFTASTQRFVGVNFTSTGLWHIPEIILSETRTFVRGASMDDAIDTLEHQNLFIQHGNGAITVIELGGDRRRFEATWHNMHDADLTLLEEFIAEVGTSRPFLIDPPSFSATPDTDEPTRWVRLAGDVQRRWANPATGTGIKRQTMTLVFEDHLG